MISLGILGSNVRSVRNSRARGIPFSQQQRQQGTVEEVAVAAFFCVAKPAPFCGRRADKHNNGSAQDGIS
jgi:hypothetical protein